jgi:hypothetical protein
MILSSSELFLWKDFESCKKTTIGYCGSRHADLFKVADRSASSLQIAEKFGLTYSAVSRRVGVFKNLLIRNKTLKSKFNRVKSLIKI